MMVIYIRCRCAKYTCGKTPVDAIAGLRLPSQKSQRVHKWSRVLRGLTTLNHQRIPSTTCRPMGWSSCRVYLPYLPENGHSTLLVSPYLQKLRESMKDVEGIFDLQRCSSNSPKRAHDWEWEAVISVLPSSL